MGVVLLLGVLLITTGCLGGGVEAEEVRGSSVEAMESVDTYAFNTEAELEAKAGERGMEDSLSVTEFVRGTASESLNRVKTSSNLVVNDETVDQEGYVENGTAYVRLRDTETENGTEQRGWYEMESNAASSSPVDRHLRVLEASEVEYEEEVTVESDRGNRSAHVLSVDTDTKEYETFATGEAEALMHRVGVLSEGMFEDADVGNGSLRYWVSEETGRVLRAESAAEVTTSVPEAEEELEITVETETEFSGYGGEVETEAPDGIENAEEGFEGLFSGSSSGSSESVSQRGYGSEGGGSGVVDTVEVRVSEDGDNRSGTARVITNPVSADTVTAEAVESGDSMSVEQLNSSRGVLELGIDPDGDEIVVTVTRGGETASVYNQTVP